MKPIFAKFYLRLKVKLCKYLYFFSIRKHVLHKLTQNVQYLSYSQLF